MAYFLNPEIRPTARVKRDRKSARDFMPLTAARYAVIRRSKPVIDAAEWAGTLVRRAFSPRRSGGISRILLELFAPSY